MFILNTFHAIQHIINKSPTTRFYKDKVFQRFISISEDNINTNDKS